MQEKYSKSLIISSYHDSYVQSDTLLLDDVFINFRNKYIELYEPAPAHFLSIPVLAWKVCLQKTKVKLNMLTDIYMLVIVEIGIRGGVTHVTRICAKANKIINI